MRKLYTCLLLLAAFLICGIVQADPTVSKKESAGEKPDTSQKAGENPGEIAWRRYDKGLKLAKKEGKKLFVEFMSKSCFYCKKMRTTSFKDPDIIAMLDKYYISASINGESRDTISIDGWITSGRKLVREYRITGYPTLWFLTPEGEKLTPVLGYRNKDELYNILDYLKDDLYKTVRYKDFLKQKKKGK